MLLSDNVQRGPLPPLDDENDYAADDMDFEEASKFMEIMLSANKADKDSVNNVQELKPENKQSSKDEEPIVFDANNNNEDEEPIIDVSAQNKDNPVGKEDTGDEKSYGRKVSKAQIIGIVLVILIFAFWFVSALIGGKKDRPSELVESHSPTASVVQPQAQPEIVYQYSEIPKQYPEYIDIPTMYYSDKMVASKYTTMVDNSIEFYFMGIPENYKQKISFAVNAKTYNQIASGSVIFLDYKVINIDGKDYLIDIVTNIGGI